MPYDIRIEQVAGRPIAVVRRKVAIPELPKIIPHACGFVWNVLKAQKVPGAGRHVSVYWDDEMNVEIGAELDAPWAGHGEVVGSATPAGTVATTTHFGPYQGLPAAHRAVREWCANNGRDLAGPNWEIYGHWTEEYNKDPSKIRTDVYYLLRSPA